MMTEEVGMVESHQVWGVTDGGVVEAPVPDVQADHRAW